MDKQSILDRLRECCPLEDDGSHRGIRQSIIKKLSQYDISPTSLDRWRKGESEIRTPNLIVLDHILTELGY